MVLCFYFRYIDLGLSAFSYQKGCVFYCELLALTGKECLYEAVTTAAGYDSNSQIGYHFLPIFLSEQPVDDFMQQSISTDRHYTIIIPWLQLIMDDLIGMLSSLCQNYSHVEMCFSQDRLGLVPICLGLALAGSGIDQDQKFPFAGHNY